MWMTSSEASSHAINSKPTTSFYILSCIYMMELIGMTDDVLQNVTPGFKGWKDIAVYKMSEADGVRFMLTSDDVDIMDVDADRYLIPADAIGEMMGMDAFVYSIPRFTCPKLGREDWEHVVNWLKDERRWYLRYADGSTPDEVRMTLDIIDERLSVAEGMLWAYTEDRTCRSTQGSSRGSG